MRSAHSPSEPLVAMSPVLKPTCSILSAPLPLANWTDRPSEVAPDVYFGELELP